MIATFKDNCYKNKFIFKNDNSTLEATSFCEAKETTLAFGFGKSIKYTKLDSSTINILLGELPQYKKLNNEVDMIKKIPEMCGWIGMVLIHGATAPTSISVIMGWSTNLPPLNFILIVWLGLFLFLIRAIYAKDVLYIVSNAIGFSLNSLLLSLIAFN